MNDTWGNFPGRELLTDEDLEFFREMIPQTYYFKDGTPRQPDEVRILRVHKDKWGSTWISYTMEWPGERSLGNYVWRPDSAGRYVQSYLLDQATRISVGQTARYDNGGLAGTIYSIFCRYRGGAEITLTNHGSCMTWSVEIAREHLKRGGTIS